MRVIKVDVRKASIYYKLIIDLLLDYFNTTVGVCACTRVCLPVSERTPIRVSAFVCHSRLGEQSPFVSMEAKLLCQLSHLNGTRSNF